MENEVMYEAIKAYRKWFDEQNWGECNMDNVKEVIYRLEKEYKEKK